MDTSDLRPEYQDAVRVASFGVLHYVAIFGPALVAVAAGLAASFQRGLSRFVLLVIGVVLGAVLFGAVRLAHEHQIQAVKEEMMQTEGEMMDYSSDVGVVLAPIVQPAMGLVYCSVIAGVTFLAGFFAMSFSGTKRSDAELMQ
jgi:uncharacterized protein involved in cysteine biosynthesis